MEITERIARNIVSEISSTIHQAVNLMNAEGMIIASTNPKRVGTLHKGAEKIIRERLECLEIYSDGEYQGSKMGINMPIYFKGSVVGVIGISGEWSQIEPYIDLIRKTTETMVLNSYLQKREDEVQKEQRKFLYNVLFEKRENLPENYLSEGTALGLDLSLKRRCVCISIADESGVCPKDVHEMLDALEDILRKKPEHMRRYLIYREKTQLILFFRAEENEQESVEWELEEFEREIRRQFLSPMGTHIKMGIDDRSYSGYDLRIGKIRAEKSLKAAMVGADTVYYIDMTVGVFLSEITEESKWEYIRKVFGNMKRQDVTHWIELLEIFYECDGSINKTSEKMFIHKNTLQYQLKKLASITGYDPRSIRTAGVYQNAIWFWKTMISEGD